MFLSYLAFLQLNARSHLSSLFIISRYLPLFLPTFVFLRSSNLISLNGRCVCPIVGKNQNKNGHRACERRPCNDLPLDPCWLLRGSAYILVAILGILVGQLWDAILSRIPRGRYTFACVSSSPRKSAFSRNRSSFFIYRGCENEPYYRFFGKRFLGEFEKERKRDLWRLVVLWGIYVRWNLVINLKR